MRKTGCLVWATMIMGHSLVAAGQATESRYVIQPDDVVSIRYVYTPEYDYVGAVQPDGYLAAPVVGEIRLGGLTLPQAREAIAAAAGRRLRDPEVFVDLKEFDKPHFVVGGEVGTPGRFELRSPTTVLEAIAIAGGFKASAENSQVLLLRPHDPDHAEATLIDVRRLTRSVHPDADIALRAGDMLLVPQNRLSKVERIVKWTSLGIYVNPFNPLNKP
jgi:polysaccharide export outer membrane protein